MHNKPFSGNQPAVLPYDIIPSLNDGLVTKTAILLQRTVNWTLIINLND